MRTANRGFQILVGILWHKHIFTGLTEMVHRIAHGFHPVLSPNLQNPSILRFRRDVANLEHRPQQFGL
jgi:hypothetical protein